MKDKPDIAERIGTAINELDIDFSRLSIAGWIVSLLSLFAGGGIAYFAANAMIRRNGLDLAAGMVFCLTMIAVTTISFLALRWVGGRVGLLVTKPQPLNPMSDNANRDTLKRMADAGMDLTSSHSIDFWHLFPTNDAAQAMARQARDLGFNVASVEENHESGGHHVLVRVDLVPTLMAINKTEQSLAAAAAQHGGHADGWGVKQER